MSGGSDFTGVKLPEFDVMAAKHTQAADRLEELARALHRELQGAGLDTTPAARIRELAAQVGRQAEDLRRRQVLIQEMQREKVAFGLSLPEGSYLHLPDKLETARALLDGSVAANAARQAAQGDAKALERLKKYADRLNDAEFTKVFIEKLGAHGLTGLPAALAKSLHEARREKDAERLNHLSEQGKQVLAMLSEALAQATDPKHPAYAGDAFLDALQKEGRAEHLLGDIRYSGYQSQALIWAAHDGKPPFSAKFMQTVGQDAIAYEAELYADRWAASKSYGFSHLSLPNIAGVLDLGTYLKPGPGVATAEGTKIKPSVVEDLLHAAGFNKEASQALLAHTPPGWKVSILAHLVTTRLDVFKYTHQQSLLNSILINTTTGQDPNSKKLAADMINALSVEAEKHFRTGDDGNLEIANGAALDRMDHLQYPLGRALAANIDQVFRLLVNRATFHGVDAERMSWAIALAVRDDKAFEALMRAQTEHMRHALAGAPPVGLNKSDLAEFGYSIDDLKQYDGDQDGVLSKSDVKDALVNLIVAEARPFGHIVEIRRQALIAQGLEDKKADEALRTMVRDAIGLFPVPGAKQVSELATGAFGSLLTKEYEKITNMGYDEIARRVASTISESGRSLGETHSVLAGNRLAVSKLSEQLIATAMLSKGVFDGVPLRGQSFAVEGKDAIIPFEKMTPAQYADFLEWAGEKGGAYDLRDRFDTTFRKTNEVDDYLNLRTSSNTEADR
ncbi:hypothetical protein AB0K60_01345 [Thermopolyspora sp. NPDC052614]|uniref:hypothetical protein n=1 Tax=Thermopolyspora sp. NPDC052614 TaxID=3155682 RepID=UPI00341CE2E2